MRRVTAMLLAATFVPAILPPAAASPPGSEHRLVGEVVRVDPEARSLDVRETLKRGPAHEIHFVLAEDAKVLIRGKEATLAEVSPGDAVTVRYIDAQGRLVARSIDVAKPAERRTDQSADPGVPALSS